MPVIPRPPSGFHGQDERDHPWIFDCDRPKCDWRTAHSTQERAQEVMDTHDCPHSIPIKIGDDMPVGLEFIKIVWDRMDDLFESWTNEFDLVQREIQVAEMRGMATVIAHWMPPYLDQPSKIAQELSNRYKGRMQGQMPNTEGVEYRAQPKREVTVPIVKGKPGFPEVSTEIRASVVGSNAVKIPILTIAEVYSISVDHVRAILAGTA